MSRRTSRHEDGLPPEARLVARVQEVAVPPLVESIEEHFAGYFNELGITLRLSARATDEDIIALRNNVLACLEKATSELAINFKWLVSMYRGQDQVALIFPGNSPIPSGHRLELVYESYR